MTYRSFLSPPLLGWLAVIGLSTASTDAYSQAPPPPLPPPEGEAPPLPSQEPASAPGVAPAPATTTSATPLPAPVESNTATSAPQSLEAPNAPVATSAGAGTAVVMEDDVMDSGTLEESDPNDPESKRWFRKTSLQRQTSLNGSTGLHRVKEAGSGAPGTFRFSYLQSYFSASGFLCNADTDCIDPITGDLQGEDKATRSDSIIALSVTPFSFLEAFAGLHNTAVSNSNGVSEQLLAVGDMNFGVKGFYPQQPDQIFSFGGELDLLLLGGLGSVGAASKGAAVNFSARALGTLNLNNRTRKEDRIPLRVHLNLGYTFNNTSKLVESVETTPRPEGRGAPIERIERYGLGISRVDAFEIGLGAEYVNPYVRPFLEWTLDVPVNRQNYICEITRAEAHGDECLGSTGDLASSPSRLTLGTRVYPWQASGLALTAALDIGTGGKKRFLEETTPESLYSLWFGVAYAVDVIPAPPVEVAVEAPQPTIEPEIRRYILGRIVDETEGTAISDAIIRYDGVPMTGLVADSTGQFISQDLPPGEYSFKISANQFQDGICTVSIPESAPPLPSLEEPAPAPVEGQTPEFNDPLLTEESTEVAASAVEPTGPYTDDEGTLLVPLDCKLQPLPKVANVTGLLVDSVSGGPVAGANVVITDTLNRSLKLDVDAKGSFQFRNVPFGEGRITASAPGYLTTVSPINIESRDELKPHLLMNARPAKLALKIGRKEIKVNRPILFVNEEADVTIDSMSMIEELAEALKEKPEIEALEVQVHTDDSGAASYSRRISQERADRIVEILVQLGVNKNVLTAKGYGPDQPLAPNTTEANQAANNRVQFILP